MRLLQDVDLRRPSSLALDDSNDERDNTLPACLRELNSLGGWDGP